MIDFRKIAPDLYVLYVDGVKVTSVPVTRKGLYKKIESLPFTKDQELRIERFFNGSSNKPNK